MNTRHEYKSLGHLPAFCHLLCALEFSLPLPRLSQTLLRTMLGRVVVIAHCHHLGHILSICPINAATRAEHWICLEGIQRLLGYYCSRWERSHGWGQAKLNCTDIFGSRHFQRKLNLRLGWRGGGVEGAGPGRKKCWGWYFSFSTICICFDLICPLSATVSRRKFLLSEPTIALCFLAVKRTSVN